MSGPPSVRSVLARVTSAVSARAVRESVVIKQSKICHHQWFNLFSNGLPQGLLCPVFLLQWRAPGLQAPLQEGAETGAVPAVLQPLPGGLHTPVDLDLIFLKSDEGLII